MGLNSISQMLKRHLLLTLSIAVTVSGPPNVAIRQKLSPFLNYNNEFQMNIRKLLFC